MPNVKISALPAGAAVTGTELDPAVQGGATVSLTAAQRAAFAQGGFQFTDSGAANAYVVTSAKPLQALNTGQLIGFIPAHPNTGASTIAINGAGAVAIVDSQGAALVGGELVGPVLLIWTGSQCELLWSLPVLNNRTPAERAAGVIPTNYAYPSHKSSGYVFLERYGGAGDNSTINNAAFAAALLVAGQVDAPIGLLGGDKGVYKFTTGLVMTGTGQALAGVGAPVGGAGVTGCRIIGLEGRPLMSFSGLGSTTDCLTLGGANLPQVELRNLQIQCNGSVASPNGRDGVVILGSNKPIINNVLIWNSQRDAFVLSPNGTSGQWIEKGQFDIQVLYAGRHGAVMSLLGTGNPYVNECEWRYELRGCSYVTAGGNALRMTAVGGLSGAAKFSDHRFYSTVWDCIYQTSGVTNANQLPQLPDVSPVNIDSGIAQAFIFINPAWENTANGGLPGAGYACHVSGSGTWGGLTAILTNINSFWGSGIAGVNPDPAIAEVNWLDFSLGKSSFVGPMSVVMSSDGAGAGVGVTGNTTATAQPEFRAIRTGANVSAIGQGACILLGNNTTNTFLAVQEQNGSIALWSFSGGQWGQRAVVNPNGGIQFGTAGAGTTSLSTLYSVNGGPPSVGLGSNGDYALRQDTPGTANQRLYVKSAGAWVGIL